MQITLAELLQDVAFIYDGPGVIIPSGDLKLIIEKGDHVSGFIDITNGRMEVGDGYIPLENIILQPNQFDFEEMKKFYIQKKEQTISSMEKLSKHLPSGNTDYF